MNYDDFDVIVLPFHWRKEFQGQRNELRKEKCYVQVVDFGHLVVV